MASLLLVGFSHVAALIDAYQQRVAQQRDDGFRMAALPFDPHGRHKPTEAQAADSLVNPVVVREDMEKLIASEKPDLIVASLWGNQHFFLCASNSPRPYDFVLPDEPERELAEGVEIIPFDLLYRFMEWTCARVTWAPPFFRTFTMVPIVTVSAPPPVEHVLEIPGGSSNAELDAKVMKFGLAPPALRYKYWRVCEQIFRGKCDEQNVPFLPAPPDTVNARGFRYREYNGSDWIHANQGYGEAVLRQISKLLN